MNGYVIALIIVLIFLLIVALLYNKNKTEKRTKGLENLKKQRKNDILIISIASVMMALGAVLKVFGIMLTPNMRISFFALPLILSGFICGMEYGILTALGADLIYSLFSGYAFNPAFTISAIYWGVLGGIFRKLKNKDNLDLLVIFLGIFITSLLETHTNLLATYVLYGTFTAIADLLVKYLVLIIKLPILSLLFYFINKRVIDRIQLLRSIK